jgi:hypothetical protein
MSENNKYFPLNDGSFSILKHEYLLKEYAYEMEEEFYKQIKLSKKPKHSVYLFFEGDKGYYFGQYFRNRQKVMPRAGSFSPIPLRDIIFDLMEEYICLSRCPISSFKMSFEVVPWEDEPTKQLGYNIKFFKELNDFSRNNATKISHES